MSNKKETLKSIWYKRSSNHLDYFIYMYWDRAIKHCSIDPIYNTERRLVSFRLSTLILKPGYRGAGIGSQILAYLKRSGYKIIIPMGVGNKKRLRNFYERNGFKQTFIKDFEYYIYKPD